MPQLTVGKHFIALGVDKFVAALLKRSPTRRVAVDNRRLDPVQT